MSIPFFDIKLAHADSADDVRAAVLQVLESGWYIKGKEVAAFEAAFADYCGVRHCVGVGNGLDALYLLLRALEIGPGDEVIVPASTFIATWLAVSQVGARPVPVECSLETYTIDPDALTDAITPQTRAIMPVHLYGMPADMGQIVAISERHGIPVLEDAAQAHGARYDGRRAGALGLAAGFSFFPAKNLGCLGDGGGVTTDDDALAAKVRLLANYGSARKYFHDQKGVNSRLDEMHAAVLRAKLPYLDGWNQRRNEIAALYGEALKDCRGLTLPQVAPDRTHVWHQYVVRHPARDALQAHLSNLGIGTQIHYPVPPHLSEAYADMGLEGRFPKSEQLSREALSLPIGPNLSESDVTRVADAVIAFCSQYQDSRP